MVQISPCDNKIGVSAPLDLHLIQKVLSAPKLTETIQAFRRSARNKFSLSECHDMLLLPSWYRFALQLFRPTAPVMSAIAFLREMMQSGIGEGGIAKPV